MKNRNTPEAPAQAKQVNLQWMRFPALHDQSMQFLHGHTAHEMNPDCHAA